MNSIVRRTAFRAARQPAFRRYASETASDGRAPHSQTDAQSLAQRARRDPELFPLWAIVGSTIAFAAWYFTRNPTSSSSVNVIGKAENSEPWHTGKEAKYEYHVHGDPRNSRKEAPSALNEVIVPNVTLSREGHEKYNKYGKEGF